MSILGVHTVVVHNQQVLLTLRNELPVWCLPGGGVEAGESLIEAAVRETEEETGVEVGILRIVGVYSRPHWMNHGNHELLFIGEHLGGILRPQQGETTAVSYFPFNALPDNLIWWHRERITDALQTNHSAPIARLQDVRWPLENTTYQEAIQLILNNKVPLAEFIHYFCQRPAESKSILELGDFTKFD